MKRVTRWWVPTVIMVLCAVRGTLLAIVASNADRLLAYKPSFAFFATIFSPFNLPRWIYSGANFDGVYYLTIAKTGYQTVDYSQAFFPVFPLLILRPIFQIVNNPTVALLWALFSVKVFFVLFLISFFYLVSKQMSRRAAWVSVLTILIFPTSIFFGALYTESLFMLLCTLCFLAAAYKRWWLAGIFSLIASATRLIGIALIPALIIELWLSYNPKPLPITFTKVRSFIRTHMPHMLAISLGCLGLLGHMLYLGKNFQDPLLFIHVQDSFNTGRTSNLVLYPQVIWRYIKILTTIRPFDLKYYAYVQEFIAGTIGLILILWAATKVRLSYTVFALLAFFIPTLTGTFSSMPRYLLVCFPIFMIMGEFFARRPRLSVLWYAISFVWLLFNTLLFIQGYWVA